MGYKHIIFDFDGVLVESNHIRFDGFRQLFLSYPEEKRDIFIKYVENNAGLSRFEKIRYFFSDIIKEPISDSKVDFLSDKYSKLVKERVIKAKAVKGSLEFLSGNNGKYNFAIVSGSEEKELKDICRTRGIEKYFIRIMGSPVSKETNIIKLLEETGWEKQDSVLVGDSTNDLDASRKTGVDFIGRNSNVVDWRTLGIDYVTDLLELPGYLN